MARTLVTNDPVFGWLAYGGVMTIRGDTLSVIARDGLRKRFDVVLADPRTPASRADRLKLELDRDGFAALEPIVMDKRAGRIAFTLENRSNNDHATELSISLPYGSEYQLTQDGRRIPLALTGDWDYPYRATITMTPRPSRIELLRIRP